MKIEHDDAKSRFVARDGDGETGEVAYVRRGDVLDLVHTEVSPAARGRGVGGALVSAAFDYARGHDLRVAASCPFAAAWVEENPDAKGLVAE